MVACPANLARQAGSLACHLRPPLARRIVSEVGVNPRKGLQTGKLRSKADFIGLTDRPIPRGTSPAAKQAQAGTPIVAPAELELGSERLLRCLLGRWAESHPDGVRQFRREDRGSERTRTLQQSPPPHPATPRQAISPRPVMAIPTQLLRCMPAKRQQHGVFSLKAPPGLVFLILRRRWTLLR